MERAGWFAVAVLLAVGSGVACGNGPDNRPGGSGTMAVTLGGGDETASGGTGSSTGDASGDGTSTTGAVDEDSGDGGPVLDVAPATTGAGCMPGDYCCDPDAAVVHELLDAFLAAYPAASMPTTHDGIRDFAPMTADGDTMTWSKGNVGGEFVDPSEGGLTDENLEEGRAATRAAAEMAMPAGATTLAVREDPVTIMELPGGIEPCPGMGWGWGSIVYQAADLSINELAFLYIGMCYHTSDETLDVEFFGYSSEAAQLCAPPG